MNSKWKIAIEKVRETINSRIFKAKVTDGRKTFVFEVEVDKTYAKELFGKDVPLILLVQQSFMFLLEREPVTSILRDFNLREIQQYFSEYEETMQQMFTV